MHHGTQSMNAEMERCIQECLSCHAICTSTAVHCLGMGGEHASAQHQTALLDCAQACQTSADFMLRGSAHHAHVCAECADVCEDCAKSCEAVGEMDDCVAACRKCAESCRAMAGT